MPDQRRYARDGQLYTKSEFLDYYGYWKGGDEWQAKQRCARDGVLYSKSEFLEYYGASKGAEEWQANDERVPRMIPMTEWENGCSHVFALECPI